MSVESFSTCFVFLRMLLFCFFSNCLSMASLSASRGVAPVVSSSSYKQRPLRAPTSATRAQQEQLWRRRRDACSVVAVQAAVDAASSTTTTASTSSPPSPLPSSPLDSLPSLIGMPLEELEGFVESELGEPRARARQLFRWLYCSGGARVGGGGGEEEGSEESGRHQTPPSPSPSSWSDAPGPETAGGFSSAFLAKVSPFPSLLDPGIELVGVRRSADGTRKLLFLLTMGPARGKVVDAVLIPSAPSCSIPSSSSSPSSSTPPPRLTLCVSSQAGCAMGCAFCLTGAQGLSGSLSSAQIVGQLVAARQLLRRDEEEEEEEEGGKGRAGAGAAGGGDITNVVFMGQGEPLDNLDAVVAAVRVMTDPRAGSMSMGGNSGGGGRGASAGGGDAFPLSSPPPRQWSLSPNRVTVSTVGLVPQLRSLAARCDVQVALSLHAASEGTRRGIVPATARHGTAELRQALEELFPRRRRRKGDGEEADASSSSAVTATTIASPGRGKRRHVLIEMTLLSGVNDSDDDARLLLEFLSEIEAKVNLIPWNPHPGSPFSPPSAARVEAFKQVVQQGDGSNGGEKRVCTVRMARGADEAMAACGQLGEVGLVPRAARARLVAEEEEARREWGGGSSAV